VDGAVVYDNSESTLRPFMVKENNEIKTIDDTPTWAKDLVKMVSRDN
jgi:predicted ABC-type ATPase